MYVSSQEFLYTFLLSDQSELQLNVDWKGPMFANLLKIVNEVKDARSQYPSDIEFLKSYREIELKFFRMEKQKFILPEDEAPMDIVIKIYEEFGLKKFYSTKESKEVPVGRELPANVLNPTSLPPSS